MSKSLSTARKICLRGFRPIYTYGEPVGRDDPRCYKVKSGLVLLSGGPGGIEDSLTPCILQAGDYFGEEEILGLDTRLFSAYSLRGTKLDRPTESPEVMVALLTDAVQRHSIQAEVHAFAFGKDRVRYIRQKYADLYLAESLIAKLAGLTREAAARV